MVSAVDKWLSENPSQGHRTPGGSDGLLRESREQYVQPLGPCQRPSEGQVLGFFIAPRDAPLAGRLKGRLTTSARETTVLPHPARHLHRGQKGGPQ